MKNSIIDVVIIGSGPAGLTAAIYASRADLKPVLFAGTEFGGQLMGTTDVENYPGFKDGITGPVLMQEMIEQAKKFGTTIHYKTVKKVDLEADIKTIKTEDGEFKAKSVIIATGAKPRLLNVPGEEKFYGKGVSTCATCDGAFYRDKDIAVVGGGDSAMEEAVFLTKFAKKVYLIHRREEFRASKIMQDRAKSNPKIEILWNSEVSEVKGDKTVDTLVIHNNKEEKTSDLKVDGLFLAIGHIPNTDFLEGVIDTDDSGYIQTRGTSTHTSLDGVFAAGDVYDSKYRQAITSAGMGCKAALDAMHWLENQEE